MSGDNGTLDEVCQPSVIELARGGDFQAIAYWLNVYLVPQEIYVRVGADRPGYLLVLTEFQRMPDRERFLRFVCHRLYKLNSELIEGVRIISKFVGSSEILWDHSVRFTADGITPQSSTTSEARPSWLKLSWSGVPSWSNVSQSLPVLQSASSQWVTTTVHRLTGYAQQMKKSHAIALGGSAAAAFFVGCGVEALHYSQPPTAKTDQTGLNNTAVLTQFPSVSKPAKLQTALGELQVSQQAVLNPNDPTVTLLFSNNSALDPTTPQGWYRQDSTAIDAYRQADVAMTNLNVPIALPSAQSATPPPMQTLTRNGVDIVNLASAQMLEEGTVALERTLHALEQAGIHSVGVGRNEENARRPEILDVKGQRIAYLGYSGTDLQAASADRAGFNVASEDQIKADIQAIRAQVDWVVVNFRWNQELDETPADWQIKLAHYAVDQGADLVVGHHPEVLQGGEIYKGRAIAYSLGDFIFADSTASQSDYDTAALKVSIRDRQMRLEFLPVQVRQSKPVIAADAKGTEILKRIEAASAQFEQPMRSATVLDAQIAPALPHSAPTTGADSFISYPSDAPSSPAEGVPTNSSGLEAGFPTIAPNSLIKSSPTGRTPNRTIAAPPEPETNPAESPSEDTSAVEEAIEEPTSEWTEDLPVDEAEYPEESADYYAEDYSEDYAEDYSEDYSEEYVDDYSEEYVDDYAEEYVDDYAEDYSEIY
jgi:poly-gamma-glutamate capsule biosynthesis protein CapA/YwtB (metallophosphatase superfamily)